MSPHIKYFLADTKIERTRTKAGMIHALEIAYALEETATYRGTEVHEITNIVGISDPLRQDHEPGVPSPWDGQPPSFTIRGATAWCKHDLFEFEQKIIGDLNNNAGHINSEIRSFDLNKKVKGSNNKRGEETTLRCRRIDIVVQAIQQVLQKIREILDVQRMPPTMQEKLLCITEGKLCDLGTVLQDFINNRKAELLSQKTKATTSWFSRRSKEIEEIETELNHIETTSIQREQQMQEIKQIGERLAKQEQAMQKMRGEPAQVI
tara:strand:+ start:1416 stop:2207 length:792 start_codon:yes stop_codon:yes gene_type:complete